MPPDSAQDFFDAYSPSDAELFFRDRDRFMRDVQDGLYEAKTSLGNMEETLSQVQQHLTDAHSWTSYELGKYLRACAEHLEVIKWVLIGFLALAVWRSFH